MHSNRFWELMAKQLWGELTPEELQELMYLKGEDEFAAFNKEWLQSLSHLSLQDTEEITGDLLHQKWDTLLQKTHSPALQAIPLPAPAKYKRLLQFAAIAASLLVAVVISWKYIAVKPAEINAGPNIVSTRNGSKSKIQMPDGTQVWLNAGSSLTYNNETYGQPLREAILIGEAYFDVVKDERHPFIIHTKTMDVKVLGTAFNVRAYPNEKQSEAALIRGSIEVSFPGRPAEKLFLKPNEKISVANNWPVNTPVAKNTATQAIASDPIIVLSTLAYEPADSAIIETSWTRNKLIFRSKSFEELAQDLERWYNVSIRFKDTGLMQRHLTGTFQNETIFEALNYLKLSSPFQYQFNKETNTVTLYR